MCMGSRLAAGCSLQTSCHTPPAVCRPDVLDRFAVINVQYQHLLDALRPLLRQFAAYPRSVNQVGVWLSLIHI